jgi:DNA-binding MarR family transcriptional regulator
MEGRLPLSALLSRALVAFIIEFDNEFERQMPHRTTIHGFTPGSAQAPWLVSMVMWSKFMRFIPQDGISVGELQRLLRIDNKDLQGRLTRISKWWGYVAVGPDKMVRPTPAGRRAQEIWRPLPAIIENRWQERFGRNEIGSVREYLSAVASQLDSELPDSLPILGYGLFSRVSDHPPGDPDSSLPALLSKVLLAFAIEFERESDVSLAICADVLRLAVEEGTRARDLPRLAGVSREAIAMSLKFLEKRGYAVIEPDSLGSRTKALVLTAKGRQAQETYHRLVWMIEERWRARLGNETIRTLRDSLERLEQSVRVPEPYPGGWRASVPTADGLPHYPMILHRGGFPDGS